MIRNINIFGRPLNWLTNFRSINLMVDQLSGRPVSRYFTSMANIDILNSFQKIQVESAIDKIIKQIRGLVVSRQLNPGDRLLSERKLLEKLGVGRGNVRDAIKKLEFYGILKT